MEFIPFAMILFKAPKGLDEKGLAKIGVELEGWHLMTGPATPITTRFQGVQGAEMARIRRELRKGRGRALALEILKPSAGAAVGFDFVWTQAVDFAYGKVCLLWMVPADRKDLAEALRVPTEG